MKAQKSSKYSLREVWACLLVIGSMIAIWFRKMANVTDDQKFCVTDTDRDIAGQHEWFFKFEKESFFSQYGMLAEFRFIFFAS